MKSIRVALPEFPYIRCLYYAFLKLIDSDKADIRILDNAVEILAKGDDIRPVLSSAVKYAVELGNDYKQRGFSADFPMSGNDKKIFKKLVSDGGLSEVDMLHVLERYANTTLIKEEINELQSALEYGDNAQFSPFQTFLLDTYSLTRAPFFNSNYKHQLRMNLHQMMICTAGYIAARCSRIRDHSVTVLILPFNLKVTRYDFYKNIRKSVVKMPGMSPEEAVILWIALDLPNDFSEDILVLCVDEPGQSMKPISSITISNDFWLRTTRLRKLRGQKYYYGVTQELLRYAMEGSDDAREYVKLLYLAVQEGFERGILELALRSSRREASLVSTNSSDDTRREVAKRAREISCILLGM